MIPSDFEYHAPASFQELLDLLSRHGEAATLLAGGQTLVPDLVSGRSSPDVVLDLRRVQLLPRVEAGDGELEGGLVIGPLVTYTELIGSALARQRVPLLVEAALSVGDPATRNAGTLVGAVCGAHPASDVLAALCALDAVAEIASTRGARRADVESLILGPREVDLRPDEVVRCLRLPPSGSGGAAHLKLGRSAQGYGLVGVAVQVALEDGRAQRLAIGITGYSRRPFRAVEAEDILWGRSLDAVSVAEASRAVVDAALPRSDAEGSGEFRSHLVDVALRRALHRAAGA